MKENRETLASRLTCWSFSSSLTTSFSPQVWACTLSLSHQRHKFMPILGLILLKLQLASSRPVYVRELWTSYGPISHHGLAITHSLTHSYKLGDIVYMHYHKNPYRGAPLQDGLTSLSASTVQLGGALKKWSILVGGWYPMNQLRTTTFPCSTVWHYLFKENGFVGFDKNNTICRT